MADLYKNILFNFYFVLFVDVTVIERDRVTERVIVALVVGDMERLSVTLGVSVNGRVVAMGLGLTVTDTDLVAKAEAGTVYGAEGDLVTERVSVTETVGLIVFVNG